MNDDNENEATNEPTTEKKKNKWLLPVAIGVGSILLIALAYLAFRSGGDGKKKVEGKKPDAPAGDKPAAKPPMDDVAKAAWKKKMADAKAAKAGKAAA